MSAQKLYEGLALPGQAMAKDELWEAVFDALPGLAALVDSDHRLLKINQALAQRLGLEPAQAVGRRCHEVLHGLDHPPAYCPHALLLVDGQEHFVEFHEPRLGGHFLASAAPFGQGGCVHLLRDISDRKAAEQEAQRQNLYLESLHQTAVDLMHHRDIADLLTATTQKALNMLDSDLGWLALVEDDRLAIKAAVTAPASLPLDLMPDLALAESVRREGRPQSRDASGVFPAAPGAAPPAASAAVPIMAQGRTLGVLGVGRRGPGRPYQAQELEMLARHGQLAALALENHNLHEAARGDLAQRRQAEEALEWELTVSSALARLGQQLLIPSLTLAELAHTVLDFAQGLTRSRAGMVTARDPLGHGMISHTSGDGGSPYTFPDPSGDNPGIWGHALASGDAFFCDQPASHPAAQGNPASAAGLTGFLAVPVAFNEVVVGQIALCDPARPYQARELHAVERLARLLALAVQRLVGEAERDRLAAQLRHSQKMEALGVLAGGIAHDFNNILGTIFGFTEMAVSDAQQGNPAESDLRNVLLACQRAKDLVARLLSFSRPATERRLPLKLRPLISETVKLLRATLPSTIALRPCLCEERGHALADPTQMQQVIMNLCTNASQALDRMDSGIITIALEDVGPERVELARLHGLEPGEYTRLVVRDNGPGMPPAIQERIFEPFFTTKGGVGSGLGLAVVHGIVQAHGGGIKVTSAPGQGSVFSVLIPKADPQESREPEGSAVEPPRGQERIMLVDDEAPLLEVISRMLGRLGYQVEAFSDSRQALAAFQATPQLYDLLLSDQTMPGLTGADLAKAVLALRPELPVVLCTGFSDSLDHERARALGARLLMMKPLTRRQLAEGLREALQGRP